MVNHQRSIRDQIHWYADHPHQTLFEPSEFHQTQRPAHRPDQGRVSRVGHCRDAHLPHSRPALALCAAPRHRDGTKACVAWVITPACREPAGGRLNPLQGWNEGRGTPRRCRTDRDEHGPCRRFRWSGAGSSVSTQSAPEGIRTPNLLIRSKLKSPTRADHGRLPRPELSVFAQVRGSNDPCSRIQSAVVRSLSKPPDSDLLGPFLDRSVDQNCAGGSAAGSRGSPSYARRQQRSAPSAHSTRATWSWPSARVRPSMRSPSARPGPRSPSSRSDSPGSGRL